MLPYDAQQLAQIRKWQSARPSVAGELSERALSPLSPLVERFIPRSAVQTALETASSTAQWLADVEQIRRRAQVPTLALLQEADLERCDALAKSVRKEAMAWAAAEGGLAGAAGLPGLLIDMPAVTILALRAVHRTAACYGFQLSGLEGQAVALEILRIGGANTMLQKREALGALHGWVRAGTPGLREVAATLLAHRLVGDAARHLVTKLSRELGSNLVKRKMIQAVPLIGAAIGAGVNAWYLRDVCQAARRVFQEKHLQQSYSSEDFSPNADGN
jgi:hypothetical protein